MLPPVGAAVAGQVEVGEMGAATVEQGAQKLWGREEGILDRTDPCLGWAVNPAYSPYLVAGVWRGSREGLLSRCTPTPNLGHLSGPGALLKGSQQAGAADSSKALPFSRTLLTKA